MDFDSILIATSAIILSFGIAANIIFITKYLTNKEVKKNDR